MMNDMAGWQSKGDDELTVEDFDAMFEAATPVTIVTSHLPTGTFIAATATRNLILVTESESRTPRPPLSLRLVHH